MKTPGGTTHFRHSRAVYAALLVGISLLSLSFAALVVRADTTTTYTSTADFDGGDKGDPGTDYFVSNGIDQSTYSVSKPPAIYVAAVQRTYVVYQGGGNMTPHIAYYDHEQRAWSAPVEVNDTNPISGDGHGAPAMWVDDAGYIYVFFGAHATPMQLKRSASPYAITDWVQLVSPTPLPVPGNQATYPHLFQRGSLIYFLYRQGTAVGGDWGFRTTANRGDSWSAFTKILDFGTDGAYIADAIYVASQSKVYYTFVWDERVEVLRHNAYVCVWNLATNKQYGINGIDLGTVVDLAEADANCRAVYSGSVGQLWYSTIALDSMSRPYMLYVNGTGVVYNTYNVSFTYWTGSAWASPQDLALTDGISSYPALKVVSATNVIAYIVTGGFRQLADPSDDYSGDLERWTWDGATWTFAETIMSEARAGNPVNRPFVPLNAHAPIDIIFDSWEPKDTFVPEAKMWAWGSAGFVHRMEEPSGTLGTQTITDNLIVPNGGFVLANGRSDTFATPDMDAFTYFWGNIRTGDGAGTLTRKMLGGKYIVSGTDLGTSGRLGATLRSSFGVDGTIDFSIKYDLTDPPEDNNVITAVCLFDQPDECDSVSGDYYDGTSGVYYQFLTSATALPPTFLTAVKRVGGVLTDIGSLSNPTCDPCWLRIRKAGTLFTFYYSTDGLAWTQDEQQDIAALSASTWYLHFTITTNGVFSGSWAVEATDYSLTTGSMIQGYRPQGSWSTPVTTYAGEIAHNVTVTYSGASANGFIDAVAVVDAVTGRELWEDTTDVINGTSVFYAVPASAEAAMIGRDFVVRVTLAGDQDSSPLVTSVTVSTARAAALVFVDNVVNVFWLIFFAVLLATIVAVAWTVKEWRGV